MSGLFRKFLTLFGEGGGAGGDGGAGAGTGAEGAGAAAQAQAQAGPDAGRTGKAEDLSKVVYGKQAQAEQKPAPAAEAPETKTETKRPTFDELMQDPEYKSEFQKRFDKQFNKRFGETKAQQEQMARLAPALNLLAGKYGVEAGDLDGLLEAINSDNELIERQAYDKGMEPDAYREYNRLMAENQQLKQAEQERQRQTREREAFVKWTQQAEQARRIYPGLNLQTEIQNPQFAQLLGAGIDVATAYQVVHMGELSSQLVQKTAEEVKTSTVKAMQANRGRPRENGTAAPKAATMKSDVGKLKPKDFDEIIRRAARGEKISW